MEMEFNTKSWTKPVLIVLSSKQTFDGCDLTKTDGVDDGNFPGFSCATITS